MMAKMFLIDRDYKGQKNAIVAIATNNELVLNVFVENHYVTTVALLAGETKVLAEACKMAGGQ